MAIVKILAPLTGGPRDAVVLASAFAAARPFHAHVVALFVRPDATEAVPFFGDGVSAQVVQEIAEAAKAAADAAIKLARASLEAAANTVGAEIIAAPAPSGSLSASFREVLGNFADQVTLAARLSDLVVFGPLKEGDRPGLTEAFEATLLETGQRKPRSAFLLQEDRARVERKRRVGACRDRGPAVFEMRRERRNPLGLAQPG
jgi:hypothetical protein